VDDEDGRVKEDYLTENIYGFKVPDLDKIREDADNLFVDENLKTKYRKDIENTLQFSIDVPKEKLTNTVSELFEEQYGQPLDSLLQSEFQKGFKNAYGKELDTHFKELNQGVQKVKEDLIKNLDPQIKQTQDRLSNLTAEYKAKEQQILSTPAYTNEESETLKKQLETAYREYESNFDKIITENAKVENEYNARLNNYAARQSALYDQQVKALVDKYSKDYKLSPEVASKLNKVSKDAAEQLLKESNKTKEGAIIAQGYFNPLLKSRFLSSTVSSFGGVMSGWATSLGGDGEYGDALQQFFQPSVAPIKSLEDLTAFSFTESAGNLVGSMLPSLAAGIATGIATKNMGLASRIILTGAAGWTTETIDIAGRQYKEALERTGSVSTAKDAAKEAIEGQVLLAPTYLLESAKFVQAFKKISNPILRIGTGALVEYTGEFIQEYPQGLMERSISTPYYEGGGEFENLNKYISTESAIETGLNLLPVLGLGGAGAISKETESILNSNPDIAMQYLSDIIYEKGISGANFRISQLYNQGIIDYNTFISLGKRAENFETANSREYNAILTNRDLVAEAAENEQDAVKKKVLLDQVKAYEGLMERVIMGQPVNLPKIKVGEKEYLEVTKNPIKSLKALEEQDKIPQQDAVQEQTTSEVPVQPEAKVEQGVTQEVSDYIDNLVSETEEEVFGGKKVVDSTLEKMNNAEYVNDTEIDNSIEAVFNEIDRVNNLDISDKAKKNITDELYNIAEQLDNYEFRTKTTTSKVTPTESTEGGAKTKREIPKKSFKGKVTGIGDVIISFLGGNRISITPQAKKGKASRVTEFTFPENYLYTDESGQFSALTVVDTEGNEIIINDPEIGIPLVINNMIAEMATVTTEVVEQYVTEEINYIKENKNAVQEQTTSEVSVQPEAKVGEKMAEGKPKAETKVTAEEGQEKLTEAEKNKIAEKIGKVGKVTPKNIKGLLDVMGGIFGLNKKQAESAAVVGDVIIGNAAKRAGISKDEMYQKIA
jgi:hypothetical protein